LGFSFPCFADLLEKRMSCTSFPSMAEVENLMALSRHLKGDSAVHSPALHIFWKMEFDES
jgi:hypothetical protein